MEGLSQAQGQGYAQVLGEGYDNLKNVIAWQEKAEELDAKKKEAAAKRKAATDKELSTAIGKLPIDLYEKHNPVFEQNLNEFLDYTYQNADKMEGATPERMEWEKKKHDLFTFASQSKNFREQLEAIEKQRAKLSPESLEYLDKVKTGVAEDGTTPILSMDDQKLYFNPDYSKIYAHPEVRAIVKPKKSSILGQVQPTGVKGAYSQKKTETEELTKEDIDLGAQFGFDNMNEAEKQNATRAFVYDLSKGGPDAKQYESFIKVIKDENGNDVTDYSVAVEEYVKDKFRKNLNPYKKTKESSQTIYEQRSGGYGYGDTPKVSSEVVTEEENRNVLSTIQEGGMKGKQWYTVTDKNGKKERWLRDPLTYKYYKSKSADLKEWEPVSDAELRNYEYFDPVVVGSERTKEVINYNDKNVESRQVKWVVPYVMEEDGSVTDTRLNQGVIGTPKEAKIAWVTKDGKQFDSRPEVGDSELKFVLTVSDQKGHLQSFPVEQKHIDQLKAKYEGIDLALWEQYKRMKAQGAKPPSASKPSTQAKPAKKKKYNPTTGKFE